MKMFYRKSSFCYRATDAEADEDGGEDRRMR